MNALVLLLIACPLLAHCQLSLPHPPYLPPNASFGAQPANSSDVSHPNPQWSALLGNLLYFYDAQRSGKLPADERVSWRNDSAVSDGQDVGLDLSGGYYDAGDYIKCTFPLASLAILTPCRAEIFILAYQSFTLMSACWGALTLGKGYDMANQTPYLDDMLRWGLDWMIKAHPSSHTLFVQVGDGDLDDAYWGGDQGIPGPRPSYQINDTSPGTDAAAQAAAAFAACSALYSNHTLSPPPASPNASLALSPASLQNATYASTLLAHAQQLWDFATNATGGQRTYQTSVPAAGEAYASSGYGDELTVAGFFLSLASLPANPSNSTNSPNDTAAARSYYASASTYFEQFELSGQLQPGQEQVFNWDSKTPGAVVLAAQIAKAFPDAVGESNSSRWTALAEGYFDTIVNSSGRGFLTGGGLLYYPGDSDEASLNPALNAAMLMVQYASAGLASSQSKAQTYLTFAQAQLDYALGNNPMEVPYVVGAHPNSPANPHSALATGASPADIANIDTVPAQERYILYGALVGGPDTRGRFWDLRGDWVQSEVALDYNAPLLTLASFSLVNASGDPYYTALQPGSNEKLRPKGWPCDAAYQQGCAHGLSTGAKIAMGVVLGIVGCVILGLGAYWLVLASRNSRHSGFPEKPITMH
ncbi:Six-hairpin glycosidase [Obba rivulosa]|uniref:Endoglucanase n=1 Tax=Obba rivulosa TaxID=1052685 RepID=A0A8E2AYW4_9APHY|nr:Six-hairpin glycosidase [Obba rivulosa]